MKKSIFSSIALSRSLKLLEFDIQVQCQPENSDLLGNVGKKSDGDFDRSIRQSFDS